jgi:hypothetical protein
VADGEIEQARRAQFALDHYENRRISQGHRWLVRDVMPLNFERICAVVTPWRAYVGDRSHPQEDDWFEGLAAAYKYFGRPVPNDLGLDRWHEDFQIIEQAKILTPGFRVIMERFSRQTNTIYVRCFTGVDRPVFNWKIERELFFALDDPFHEMPESLSDFQIFPANTPWFIHAHDLEPILYLAGPEALVHELREALGDRVLSLTLDDRYY